MQTRTPARAVLLLTSLAIPAAAFAQRVPFERTITSAPSATLDVSTVRGKIEIIAGAPGRIVVAGEATVRVGWDVPANAEAIARRVASAPPIEQVANTIRLRDPSDHDAQRAVTVSYRVEVPPDTRVQTVSISGETSIRGVAGAVTISTGSGAVTADELSGALSVTTTSGSFKGTQLRSSLRARTESGDINAELSGAGNVDVETGSSAITLHGVHGGLAVKTRSGRVIVQGTPTADWIATTKSSSVSFEFAKVQGFALDVESHSGSVTLVNLSVKGSTSKRSAKGVVGAGGPLVQVRSGSGAIRIQAGEK